VSRPVTLFTGQWADLPLPELAKKAAEWGFDGLELASWGDHFDVAAAIAVCDPMLDGRRSILGSHLAFGDPDRGWEFVSPGHGDVDVDVDVESLIDFPASQSSFDVAFAEESHHG
jgi:sugar phosphate isomerase/epimerase